jgi:hypothetical protein
VVTPAGRTPSGNRLFSAADVARLDLVRTLRDLGIDLPTARRVSDREIALPEVAAAHAEALTRPDPAAAVAAGGAAAEGDPAKRAFTLDEMQALLDSADARGLRPQPARRGVRRVQRARCERYRSASRTAGERLTHLVRFFRQGFRHGS